MSPSVTHSRLTSLGDVTPNNIGQLKKLNSILFPVNYGPNFYDDVLQSGELAKLVYYNDVCVGAVCSRKETNGNETDIYIMTLGVLEAYRNLGLGKALLDHVLKQASEIPNIKSVYLHVQISNESALSFYKKHGFTIVGTAKDYYKQIEPRDAHVLKKDIEPSSSQNGSSNNA